MSTPQFNQFDWLLEQQPAPERSDPLRAMIALEDEAEAIYEAQAVNFALVERTAFINHYRNKHLEK